MRWQGHRHEHRKPASDWKGILLICLPFLLGGILGALICASGAEGDNEGLKEYLETYLTLAQRSEVSLPSFAALLWEYLRYPLFAFLMGFAGIGLIALPVLFGVRGFLLGYTITAFASVFGVDGILIAFLLIGIPELVVLPIFFALGVQSAASAGRIFQGFLQGKRPQGLYSRRDFILSGACFAVVFCWTGTVFLILPTLISAAGKFYG